MRLFPAILLLGVICSGQTRRTIGGTVVNSVTGEPLRRALVQIGGQRASFADADGRFRVEGVPDGQTSISGTKPGYLSENALLTVSADRSDVVLKLIPVSRIEGRISDSNGEPIDNVWVQVSAEEIVNGRKRWLQHGGANSDATGRYRIDGLKPGTYFVQTGFHPVFQFMDASSQAGHDAFPPQFYPSGSEISAAQPISLNPGQNAEADFTLRAERCFRLTGVAAGAQNNGVSANVEDPDGQVVPIPFQFDPRTGRFVFPMMPRGAWTLAFIFADQQGNAYSARQNVNMGASNVEGVQVVLQRAASILVKVIKGDTPPPVQVDIAGDQREIIGSAVWDTPLQIQLIATDNRQNRFTYVSDRESSDADSSLIIRSVTPGTYKVLAQTFGNSCLTSMSSGNTDLLRQDIVVTEGSQPQPIQVVLRKDCATLTGTVHSTADPIHGMALLIPESTGIQPAIVAISPEGHFSFNSLSAGDYRLYAFSDLENLEYTNPEAMRPYSYERISLSNSEKASAAIELIVR
jgi:hypothetical protein